jgi:hypothetical protein
MKRSILSAPLTLLKGPVVAGWLVMSALSVAGCTAAVGTPEPGVTPGTGGAIGAGPGTGGQSAGAAGAGGGTVNGAGGTTTTTGAGGTTTTTGAGGTTTTTGAGGTITTTGSGGATTSGTGGAMTTGSGGAGGSPPFQPVAAFTTVRKVKNLLVGLPPTDADVATVTASGAAGLQTLINSWTTDAQFRPNFKDKMVFFFRNVFQQTGFSATDDFKPQLLENGGFDFGPFGTGAVGDDAFARLVQNLQDSFALTAWQLVADGRPFSETLTTQRFMMTTALKSLYIQIEMPNDQPYAFGNTAPKLAWKINMNGTPIPLADTLNPANANYMTFDDQPPVTPARFMMTGTCQGTAMINAFGSVATTGGYSQLFQRLIGYTPRWQFLATPQCWEHASRPYFTTSDVSDWQWVTIRAQNSGEAYIQPYDIPTLRTTTTLPLKLPRVGFYTTPAFLALWNTNDSNQHRVTANQTLLVALGQSFTSANAIVPLSTVGLDAGHAVDGTECRACHKSLDPLRQFWASQLDFNDRNDFPTRGNFMGGAANPRPTATGGLLAFGNVNATGANMLALGPLLQQVQDQTTSQSIDRFAMAVTQQLCYFANSSACLENDPEFRRVALAFQNSNYNFLQLMKDLFSSPLVTGAADTLTADQNGTTISIARRDQLCSALSNRLGKPDVCALAAPIPSTAQAATLKIVSSVAADAFSRGSEIPVTPSDPTLFYRAASEMLCENVAPQVVDVAGGGASLYASTSVAASIAAMVQTLVGYPPSDPHYASAVAILQSHYDAALAQNLRVTNCTAACAALRSTFALACQSPTFLALGL